jgi:hypothetical protein
MGCKSVKKVLKNFSWMDMVLEKNFLLKTHRSKKNTFSYFFSWEWAKQNLIWNYPSDDNDYNLQLMKSIVVMPKLVSINHSHLNWIISFHWFSTWCKLSLKPIGCILILWFYVIIFFQLYVNFNLVYTTLECVLCVGKIFICYI